MNEINRHLHDALETKINYSEETFTFSNRMKALANYRKTESKIKFESINEEMTNLDSLQGPPNDSNSNYDTNSNCPESQSVISGVTRQELLPPVSDFVVKFDRRNLVVDLDRTFVDIVPEHQWLNALRSK